MSPRPPEAAASGHVVHVVAPARLHLGFLDLNGSLGRRFGGIGLAIDAPATVVSAEAGEGLTVQAPAGEQGRARRAAEAAAVALGLRGGAHLSVHTHIPPHAGLGSGTQLALAVAAALARLQRGEAAARSLAMATQRGQRSGIGIAAFEAGGFVLDGGRGPGGSPPPRLLRMPFPEDWIILLVFDDTCAGLAGAEEVSAFRELPSMGESCAGALCRRVLMQVLPGLVEHDFDAFCSGIEAVQGLVGDYFARVQSGRYTSGRVAAALERAVALGARGQGQSSWGPTGFAFVRGRSAAECVRERLTDAFRGEHGLRFLLATGRNEGALIESRTLGDATDARVPALLQDA